MGSGARKSGSEEANVCPACSHSSHHLRVDYNLCETLLVRVPGCPQTEYVKRVDCKILINSLIK